MSKVLTVMSGHGGGGMGTTISRSNENSHAPGSLHVAGRLFVVTVNLFCFPMTQARSEKPVWTLNVFIFTSGHGGGGRST